MGGALRRNGARRGHQRLGNDLATEDALPARIEACAAKEVFLQPLEIEQPGQCGDAGFLHACPLAAK